MNEEVYGKDLAKYKLERAEEELDAALLLMENKKLKAANNRAYYAIYHAITAVLCLEPIAFKKHKDTLAYFNKKYVNEGKFPKEIGREISKTEKIRHASDYDDFYTASKEETEKTIITAQKVLQLVGDYLNEWTDAKL